METKGMHGSTATSRPWRGSARPWMRCVLAFAIGERLRLGGECGADTSEVPPDYAPALTEVTGFAELDSIASLRVAGETELASLGRLHEIAAAGGLQYAGFYNNFKLPYAEIEQLEAEAGLDFDACGNLGDPEPLCSESSQFPSDCLAP
jgi:hypothetical protein